MRKRAGKKKGREIKMLTTHAAAQASSSESDRARLA